MSSVFRDHAVAALRSADEERPPVRLVPARRWLIAVALVVMVLAGIVFAVIASTRSPVRGIGYSDQGGFVTLTSAQRGIVQDGVAVPGTEVEPGDVVARIITTSGRTERLVAPGPGTVMQLLGPASGWPVDARDPVLVIAQRGGGDGARVNLLLPGVEATELTEGSISAGATVWLEPAGKDAINCVVTTVRPYAQPADSLAGFMPDPFVQAYVREQGSIQFAEARCPAGQLARFLPGTAFPVTVEIDPKRPIEYVFG